MPWPMVGTFLLLAVAVLKLASPLLLPIVVSVLLTFILGVPVRWLRRKGIPEGLGAGAVVFGAVALTGVGLWFLTDPAAEWLKRAPRSLAQAEQKIRRLAGPFAQIQKTAEKVEQVTSPNPEGNTPQVQVARPRLMDRLSGTTASFVAAAVTVIFLTYFLLASATLFREKLAAVLPTRADRKQVQEALTEIELHMSRYLGLSTLINAGVGVLTWGVLELLGMPNAALWGVLAAVLNYIPYVGALLTTGLIGFAGLVSFDTAGQAFLAAGAFFAINMVESNLVTPMALGRRLPLNKVAIFLGFLFWGWIWGVTGAVFAVPLTVMVKIICDRIDAVKPVAVFLDS